MRLEDICNKRPFSCDQQWEGQLTFSALCGVWSHCCRLFSLSAHRPSYAGKTQGDDDLLLLHILLTSNLGLVEHIWRCPKHFLKSYVIRPQPSQSMENETFSEEACFLMVEASKVL
ncbi:unnamed protein product [Durusdinium trenchii]|uniref:Uncharacterized protein n=1 Tax=Durusdinium trenchii TaxID=1381693 RepID=A0ABP0Q438_9DINO